MKGKKGNAADRRRSFDELERRAEAAERRAEKAENALRNLQEHHNDTVVGLRRELAELRRQRDEAASPQIQELREQAEDLRLRLRDMAATKLAYKRAVHAFQRRIYNVLREAGLSDKEIVAHWAGVQGEFRQAMGQGYTGVELLAEDGAS